MANPDDMNTDDDLDVDELIADELIVDDATAAADALEGSETKPAAGVKQAAQQLLAHGFTAEETFKILKDGGAITDDAKKQIERLAEAHTPEADLSANQALAVRMLHERGATESDIAKALAVTKSQVKRVIEAQKSETDLAAAQATDAVDTSLRPGPGVTGITVPLRSAPSTPTRRSENKPSTADELRAAFGGDILVELPSGYTMICRRPDMDDELFRGSVPAPLLRAAFAEIAKVLAGGPDQIDQSAENLIIGGGAPSVAALIDRWVCLAARRPRVVAEQTASGADALWIGEMPLDEKLAICARTFTRGTAVLALAVEQARGTVSGAEGE